MRRRGPSSRGVYHWVIYHPGVKLLLGIASGTQWFSDKVYGGQEGAKIKAQQTLTSWRLACQKEMSSLQNPQICLCPGVDCPGRKTTSMNGKPVRHITAWKVVHGNSLEHTLGFARELETGIAAKRAAAINAKCERAKRKNGGAEGSTTSPPPSTSQAQ